ncbi:MAG: MerR family DNA-binding protein [Proteobacteria bacterium]|nr:MerR family DNA-binding protein [Pseudomonadota bacterium]
MIITGSGIRVYLERDISRLQFIRRAQKMQFSLKEIAELLKMREDPPASMTTQGD